MLCNLQTKNPTQKQIPFKTTANSFIKVGTLTATLPVGHIITFCCGEVHVV